MSSKNASSRFERKMLPPKEGRIEHDPTIIRAWKRHAATRPFAQVKYLTVETHFAWESTTSFRAPATVSTQILPNAAPATKSDTPTSPKIAPATWNHTPTSAKISKITNSARHPQNWQLRISATLIISYSYSQWAWCEPSEKKALVCLKRGWLDPKVVRNIPIN